jgi:hypothetical protein
MPPDSRPGNRLHSFDLVFILAGIKHTMTNTAKLLFTLSIFLLNGARYGYGQDSSLLKRAPYKLTVAVDKKTVYEEELKESPFVLPDNTIQLYPGETIFIQVEQIDGAIKTIKAVREITDSANTLTISFNQIAAKKVHQQMMLKITNPLSYQLSYKATIFLLQNKKWVSTDVYPVPAGLSGFETWPEIITSIGLGKFVLSK